MSGSGPTTVSEFDAEAGGVRTYEVTPESVGLARGTLADIAGGDAVENAAIVRAILGGEIGPRRDVVLLNSAAGLLAAGKVADLAAGIALARESIDTGRALSTLDALGELSRRLSAAASRAKPVTEASL